ncbi:MAG: hypothetical protein K2Y56_23700 [Methylobacterium sp.]|uniref:hypothetical protein n=1 Tax=Methylobacterium sp. TaxID=409 RepID=UPI00260153A4|nr:hypothetical protein [Methylobacterium sp.]MBX9934482.1 hypothetical protein [Methylobacterium sp.]
MNSKKKTGAVNTLRQAQPATWVSSHMTLDWMGALFRFAEKDAASQKNENVIEIDLS